MALSLLGIRIAETSRGGARIGSLAVLPLANLSGDAGQDYFVDGMHEAVVAELSKISALKVISRTSVRRYRNTEKPLPEIARELGVNGLIEGSVVREGNQVRVSVNLIHAPSERHVWARSFDREIGSVLALHSEVAQSIASEVRVQLTPQERARLTAAPPVNPLAYDAYLRGRHQARQDNPESVRQAIQNLSRAIALDSSYAPAQSMLAEAHCSLAWLLPRHQLGQRQAARTACRSAAERALQLDKGLAEAHLVLSGLYADEWDWMAEERHIRRAVTLAPSDPHVLSAYAAYLGWRGEHEAAISTAVKAQALDPLAPEVLTAAGGAYFWARRYEEAASQFRRALELEPTHVGAAVMLGHAHDLLGNHREALAAWRRQHEILGNKQLAELYSRSDFGAAMRQWLKLAETDSVHFSTPTAIALRFADFGEPGKAMQWLERAYRERDNTLPLMIRTAYFDPLRPDPQFQRLWQRLRLPD